MIKQQNQYNQLIQNVFIILLNIFIYEIIV